ncbi:MAG: HAMP domain-containing histidine kinase [Phycisphaerales bacterium]|nr:HAMP domain-containing histidine kinase [Phycisphaerales bacterium]
MSLDPLALSAAIRIPMVPPRMPTPHPNGDASAAVAELERELIASQRLALLGSMLAMVTHEYNNLLTPILARVEAALSMDEDVPFMRKTLERTLTQCQRAIAVNRHLLDLANQPERPVTVCNLAAVVQEAIETMTRPVEKDSITLRVEVPEHLQVVAQHDLLCQVLLNLLLNAHRAMSAVSGGLLVVRATELAEAVQIEVQDNGCGIARERIDTIVNPFLASPPGQRATDWQEVGLGLSVCRLIARHHGAMLQARTNEGRGCTFTLHWPKAAGAN